MQPALGASEPLAYVIGGEGLPKMIPESEYRAAGIEPPFELLPTLDDLERALGRRHRITMLTRFSWRLYSQPSSPRAEGVCAATTKGAALQFFSDADPYLRSSCNFIDAAVTIQY
jgi:hypothetical protein